MTVTRTGEEEGGLGVCECEGEEGKGGRPRAVRASLSMAMTRGRTSLQEVIGGSNGMSWEAPLLEAIVRLE